jgi:WD40 repeat protein
MVRNPLGRLVELPATLLGFDFFISYARSDAWEYARVLESQLNGLKYSCFLDEKDMPPGQRLLPTAEKALRRSRVLLLLATPRAFQSDYVYQEVVLFGAKRTSIVVNLGNSVQATPKDNRLRALLGDTVWLDDGSDSVPDAPSRQTIETIARGFKFTRRHTKIILGGLVAAFVLLGLVSYGVYANHLRSIQRQISAAAEIASMSAQQLPLNLDNALIFAAKALQTRDTLEARGSLINAFAEASTVSWINRGHGGVRERAMFLPDGRGIVIVNGDNSVSTLDIRTQRESVEPLLQQAIQRNSTIASPASTTAVALSPNGKLLAIGTRDNSIVVWNLELHRAEGQRLEGHKNWVQELNFDRSSTLLISASDEQVVLWNLAAGTRTDVRPPNQITSQVAFSNDGMEFLVGGHAPTRFGTTNRPIPPVPEENAISVFSLPNAELKSPPLTECGVAHGQIQIRPGTDQAGCLDDDGRLRLFDWKSRTSAPMPGGEGPRTSSFSFTADGQEVAYYDEDSHEIRIRNLSAGQTVQYRLYRAFHKTSTITISPDGRFIAFVGDNVLYLLDGTQISPIATVLANAPGRVLDLAATPDGGFIALALDRARIEVRKLGSAHSNIIPLPRTSPDKQVNTITVSSDGKSLAAGDAGGMVYVWTMGDEIRGSCEVEVGSKVRSLAYSRGQNHELAAGLDNGEMVLIDGSCHPGPRVRAHARNVMALAFSPSGQLTSSGADDDVQFWSAFGQPNGSVVKANQQYVRRLVFSTTGKMFSAGQDGTVGFWSNNGAAIRHLAHELQVSSLTLSPGGNVLVSGSLDRSLGIWDVDRERIVGRAILTTDPVMGVAFVGPDKAVSGHLSGKVLMWELSSTAWAEIAQRIAGRGEQ